MREGGEGDSCHANLEARRKTGQCVPSISVTIYLQGNSVPTYGTFRAENNYVIFWISIVVSRFATLWLSVCSSQPSIKTTEKLLLNYDPLFLIIETVNWATQSFSQQLHKSITAR